MQAQSHEFRVIERKRRYVQLQQCAIGIRIAVLLFALLLQISLKGTDSLRVVALEAVDNVSDVVGPLGGVFAVHLAGVLRGCGIRGVVEGKMFAMVGHAEERFQSRMVVLCVLVGDRRGLALYRACQSSVQGTGSWQHVLGSRGRAFNIVIELHDGYRT